MQFKKIYDPQNLQLRNAERPFSNGIWVKRAIRLDIPVVPDEVTYRNGD